MRFGDLPKPKLHVKIKYRKFYKIKISYYILKNKLYKKKCQLMKRQKNYLIKE